MRISKDGIASEVITISIFEFFQAATNQDPERKIRLSNDLGLRTERVIKIDLWISAG